MHKITKVKLTISKNKILNYELVDPSYEKRIFSNFNSLQDLFHFLGQNNMSLEDGTKIAISHTSTNSLKEIGIVAFDHEDPIEYVFDDPEQAEEFAERHGYEPSVYLAGEEAKNQIEDFINGQECSFDGYKALYKTYLKEIEDAGGADCTQCAKAAIIRKYQQLVYDKVGESNTKNNKKK